MTLVEALKSGKRFRRPEMANLNKHLQWYPPNQNRSDFNYVFKETDILADDWEIESEPKPKLKAWITMDGYLRMHANANNDTWVRTPWLDEP